jgi:hypothetical protein
LLGGEATSGALPFLDQLGVADDELRQVSAWWAFAVCRLVDE